MDLRVGCSGWSYRHWAGEFYPPGLPSGRWLEHYARHFDTVEVNATFYRLQPERTVAGWAQRTPPNFRFAVKVSRYITHMLQLRDTEAAMTRFLDTLRPLQGRMGPLLHQLPPGRERDEGLLRDYLASLPPGFSHAFEFRHHSWWCEPVFDLLRERNAAFVIYNMGNVTTPVVATTREVYVRFHGPAAGYASGYDDRSLRSWLECLRALPAERTWVYFNNDIDGHAPRDAHRLLELSCEWPMLRCERSLTSRPHPALAAGERRRYSFLHFFRERRDQCPTSSKQPSATPATSFPGIWQA